MLKLVLDRKVNKAAVDSRLGIIEERLDRIERRQPVTLLYVLLFVGGFSAIIMGMLISDVNAELAGKVTMGIGLGIVVLSALTLLRMR
jgi:hypothetical protein